MSSPLANKSILIFDEDVYMARILRSVLEAFEARRIELVNSIDEARNVLALKNIDVVLCDWLHKSGSGLKHINAIRRSESKNHRQVPIVLYTAYTEISRVIAARDAGVNDILAKPIQPRAVMNKLISATTAKRRFVDADSYVGPDRRRGQKHWMGQDRRSAAA